MKKTSLLIVLGLAAWLMPMGAVAAAPPTEDGASGRITFRPHTHSSTFMAPFGGPTLFETNPVPFPITEGNFSYSSIPCDVPAPFNDVSLDFAPDYPGISDPASTRSLIELNVTEAPTDNGGGAVEGTVTTFLCENGEETDQIVFAFEGEFTKISENLAEFKGTFEIVNGTGTFADITGEGRFNGALTCLQPILEREGAESCAELGAFSDAVMTFRGAFEDPSVTTA